MAARILKRFGVREGAVTLVFVDTSRMRALNRRFHGQDRATDVLAFDLRLPAQRRRARMLGDVIIAPEVGRRCAPQYGHTYGEELLTYAAHGLLHLLGYRDSAPQERQRMERLQTSFVEAEKQDAEKQRKSKDS